MSNPNVFSVESTVSKIIVCGTTINVDGVIKQADLNKAAKDAGIRNYVVKNDEGEDLFAEDFPFEGVVRIVEYNAAKRDGVFTTSSAAGSKITVCGRDIAISGPVKQADLNKAAKDAGIRNYVVKNDEGEDLFAEDFPFEGVVRIVEYNAAKRDGVFTTSSAAGSKITVCGRDIAISGPVKQADLNKAAKDAGIRNYVVKNADGEDLFAEDFPFEGAVKIVEYNAAKTNGVFTVE
jgi:L-rhamnose mutarotase